MNDEAKGGAVGTRPAADVVPAPAGSLTFNHRQWAKLYAAGEHDPLADEFLRVLAFLRDTTYERLASEGQFFIDSFTKHFLHLLSQEDFAPTRQRMVALVALNHVIANVVAISSFRTTDAFLAIVLGQQRNVLKLLALYNPRCRTDIPRERLFAADAHAASIWYFAFFQNYKTCLAGEHEFAHMRRHLAHLDPRLEVVVGLAHEASFSATYIDHGREGPFKRHINRLLQGWEGCRQSIVNRPDRRKVAVVTGMWFPQQSVYRCMHRFLACLAEDFELTLVHLGAPNKHVDPRLFRGGVRQLRLTRGSPDISALTPNDWALALFPDVGMTVESVLCSNMRIAPVQVCGYGHPASTGGSCIDFWLGGREVESASAAAHYAERLVLIPGAGVVPLHPAYRRQQPALPADHVAVACPWYAQKINAPLLGLLQQVLARSRRRVRFHFFPGGAIVQNGLIPLRRAIGERLGADHVVVHPNLPYEQYMRVMEGCHLVLDSWPFGGYATVTDALWLGKPVVSIEGDRFFNRAGAHLLRAVGMDELVVADEQAWVESVARLVNDEASRLDQVRRLAAVDLEQALFSADHADAFRRAIHHLVAHGEALAASGEREPIVIE